MTAISYWDVHGIADELSVDVQTVRRWIQSGRLRAFKPGKEYRVREADLSEFLAAREVRPKAQAPLPLEESERGVTPGNLLTAEWALSLADEDTFQRAIKNALPQNLRDLAADLVGNYQPRLFEDVRGKKTSTEDARRARAFMRAYSIAEELRDRGEEAPESYLLALRRHMDALTSPETHHPQASQETA